LLVQASTRPADAAQATLVHRELRFARLAPCNNPPQVLGRGFGLVLVNTAPQMLDVQRELLAILQPQYVKLPVWSLPAPFEEAPWIDGYLQAVIDARGEPIGVLAKQTAVEGRPPHDVAI